MVGSRWGRHCPGLCAYPSKDNMSVPSVRMRGLLGRQLMAKTFGNVSPHEGRPQGLGAGARVGNDGGHFTRRGDAMVRVLRPGSACGGEATAQVPAMPLIPVSNHGFTECILSVHHRSHSMTADVTYSLTLLPSHVHNRLKCGSQAASCAAQ